MDKRTTKRIGPNNPNWKGGITPITPEIKNLNEYKRWRQSVFLRDNFTCQICNDGAGGNLHAHHIKHFSVLLKELREYMPLFPIIQAVILYSPMWDIKNGRTVCRNCHMKLHGLTKRVK